MNGAPASMQCIDGCSYAYFCVDLSCTMSKTQQHRKSSILPSPLRALPVGLEGAKGLEGAGSYATVHLPGDIMYDAVKQSTDL